MFRIIEENSKWRIVSDCEEANPHLIFNTIWEAKRYIVQLNHEILIKRIGENSRFKLLEEKNQESLKKHLEKQDEFYRKWIARINKIFEQHFIIHWKNMSNKNLDISVENTDDREESNSPKM